MLLLPFPGRCATVGSASGPFRGDFQVVDVDPRKHTRNSMESYVVSFGASPVLVSTRNSQTWLYVSVTTRLGRGGGNCFSLGFCGVRATPSWLNIKLCARETEKVQHSSLICFLVWLNIKVRARETESATLVPT